MPEANDQEKKREELNAAAEAIREAQRARHAEVAAKKLKAAASKLKQEMMDLPE